MANNTMNNQAAANQAAAEKANKIFSTKALKECFAKLARCGSGFFKSIISNIHDVSEMDNDQVRAKAAQTFKTAKEKLTFDLKAINSIPTFRDSYMAKDLEEALNILAAVEKELLSEKDINILGKLLLMFWSGCKAIAGMIAKSCMQAGKFVGTYGIRFIAVGLDFIIKIVKKAVKLFKEVWTVIKAIKVAKNGEEEREVDVNCTEGAYI